MMMLKVIYLIEYYLYNILLRPILLQQPDYTKKYRISICGIFKNESRFLKEWMEYHVMIGVDHFYMYNNNSEDDYLSILQPYIDKGYVTLVQWTKNYAQMEAYQDCLSKYKDETQWLAWLDIDEFIVPRYASDINEWIKGYEKYPSILIYWKMFGTSGKMKHNYEQLTTEQYVVSHQGFSSMKGKCIFNTDYDIAIWNEMTHHDTCVYKKMLGIKLRIYPINQFKRFVVGCCHGNVQKHADTASIQINHYWSKAWDIYDEKRQRTDVFFAQNPKKNLDYFYGFERQNITCDYSIFRFIMQLKHRMLGIK